jgi:hypothetical protein
MKSVASRERLLSALVPAVLVLSAAPLARADAPLDFLGPRELALGESMRADARGGTAVTLNPAGLPLAQELVFEGSYGYLGGGDTSAHAAAVSGCDSTVPIAGCLYYRYYQRQPGDDDANRFRVHEVGSTGARAFGPNVSAGITVKYFDTAGPGDDDNGWAVDGGLLVRLASTFAVAVVGHNLVNAGAIQYPRAVGAGLTARPMPALALQADGIWDLEREGSTGRYGGGIEYFISSSDRQTGYPLRAGVVHDVALDATYLTAGLGIMTSGVAFDVGGRKEMGGDELTIVASLRIFGPRQVPGTQRFQ